MALSFWYWIILVLCIVFGGVGILNTTEPNKRLYFGGSWLAVWILLVLLGLKVFGSPVQGG